MIQSPSILMTIGAFLLVLGPLVVLHELGHYLVARWCGVRSDVFSIGFGKELLGWTDRRGTRWKLGWLPLGGYVQFSGDANGASVPDAALADASPEQLKGTFQGAPKWQRALIVLAGPLTNLLAAVAVFAVFYLAVGKPVGNPIIAGFEQQSDAQHAGLAVGDRIVAIGGHKIDNFMAIPILVAPYPDQTLLVEVERNGKPIAFDVHLRRQEVSDPFGNKATQADLGVEFVLAKVGGFSERSAAQAAGLKVGDQIVSVDQKQVKLFSELPPIVTASPGKTVQLGILRGGQSLLIPVKVASETIKDAQGKTVQIGRLGISPAEFDIESVGPGEAVALGMRDSVGIVRMIVAGLHQIVVGERSVRELGGPLKIAKISGESLALGWTAFVSLAAMISINLAFINLLPIPGLDGGHLAIYAAEAIRRRPLDPRSQEWAFRTGLAFVLALMLFVTLNDIASLPIFGR